MPKAAPLNSKKESFHHDNSRCTLGIKIAPHNRVTGTAGKLHCTTCKKLNDDGQ